MRKIKEEGTGSLYTYIITPTKGHLIDLLLSPLMLCSRARVALDDEPPEKPAPQKAWENNSNGYQFLRLGGRSVLVSHRGEFSVV